MGCYAAAGDFDGDGMDELAVTQAAGNSGVNIYKYLNGNLSLIESVGQLIPGYATGLNPAAGDFDGDGVDELVVALATVNDDVRIFRFIDGHIDIANPMGAIHDVFPNYNAGVYIAPGRLR